MPERKSSPHIADNTPHLKPQMNTEGAAFGLETIATSFILRWLIIPLLDLMSEMDHNQFKRYWDENAENWIMFARADYNFYRNYLNMPAFFAMLPEVKGLSGLDFGCGEGHKPGC